jgi:hypothetical protein
MTDLILRRARTNRSSGDWSEDDYDVLCEGKDVGRIFKTIHASPSRLSTPLRSSAWSNRRCPGPLDDGAVAYGRRRQDSNLRFRQLGDQSRN